jgi:7-carboxy-7-deazaguanine synthase
VQGEGPSTGRHCGFLRLGGCNLSCRWCDTPYTWDWTGIASPVAYRPAEELHVMTVDEVLARLLALGVDLVVVSGGEPLSQQRRLLPLLERLQDHDVAVEIETNGTRTVSPELVALVRRFMVSPKLSHSGDPRDRRIVPAALAAFGECGNAEFKFVVRATPDLDEVAEIVTAHRLAPVWIMPEGRSADAVLSTLAEIADAVVRRGWNLTSRLHVLAWGERRGV